MLLTLFFAKVIGVYMVVGGLAVLMNPKRLMLAIVALTEERFASMIGGVVALVIGLTIVNLHNYWDTLPAAIVSLLGWLGIVKGLFYMLAPESSHQKIMKVFMNRKWYAIDGALVILVGAYLAGYGFGLW